MTPDLVAAAARCPNCDAVYDRGEPWSVVACQPPTADGSVLVPAWCATRDTYVWVEPAAVAS